VYVTVQPADAVMQVVPGVVLGVEDDQSGGVLPDELAEAGRDRRQPGVRHPDALRHGHGQNVEDVVPERQRDGVPHGRPADAPARLDLVAADARPVGGQQVDERERQHAGEVERDAEDHWEQRRRDGRLVEQPEVPERLQQAPLSRPSLEQTPAAAAAAAAGVVVLTAGHRRLAAVTRRCPPQWALDVGPGCRREVLLRRAASTRVPRYDDATSLLGRHLRLQRQMTIQAVAV